MTSFGTSLAFGSALELLLGPTTELVITGYCIKSTFHRTSQSDQEMVHCCCVEKEKTTLQNDDCFDFWSVHEAPTYQAFSPFQFVSNADSMSTLSSSATSHVVVIGLASVTLSVGHCQLPMAGHCTPHLQGSRLLCKTY